VQSLVELKLLEVIHTTDGKEYLTPTELGKEIREELTVRGGPVVLALLEYNMSLGLVLGLGSPVLIDTPIQYPNYYMKPKN